MRRPERYLKAEVPSFRIKFRGKLSIAGPKVRGRQFCAGIATWVSYIAALFSCAQNYFERVTRFAPIVKTAILMKFKRVRLRVSCYK